MSLPSQPESSPANASHLMALSRLYPKKRNNQTKYRYNKNNEKKSTVVMSLDTSTYRSPNDELSTEICF
jgi:hypothetical protein